MAKRAILVTGASDWVIPAKDNGKCFTPTFFKKVTQIEVRRAVKRLNTRPRKYLDYKTPAALMAQHRAALSA